MQPDPENERHPNGILAILLLFLMLSPPIGLTVWIIAAGPAHGHYLRSSWIRAGYGIIVLTALPLLLFSIFTSDPNPNPVGLGLLFAVGVVVGSISLAIGVIRVWLGLKA